MAHQVGGGGEKWGTEFGYEVDKCTDEALGNRILLLLLANEVMGRAGFLFYGT